AASVERASEHPLARAVVTRAMERAIGLADVANFDAPTGKGVTGTIDGRRVFLGSARFLAEADIPVASLEGEDERLCGDGATVIYLGVDGRAAGLLAIADPVKATTPEALKALTADGVRVVMLTGDNATTAAAVARRLGIAEVSAEVLPDQKGAV